MPGNRFADCHQGLGKVQSAELCFWGGPQDSAAVPSSRGFWHYSLPMILKTTVNVDWTYFFIRHRRIRARDPQKCSNFKIRRKKMDF